MSNNILEHADFDTYAAAFERDRGLPEGILRAVAHQESRGRADAVSPKGAVGAFQFMPQTAKEYNVDASNPWDSMRGAADFLGDLTKKYNGDVYAALAHYNGGVSQARLVLNGAMPSFAETHDYLAKITPNVKGLNPFPARTAQQTTQPQRPKADPKAEERQKTLTEIQFQVVRAKNAGFSDSEIVAGLRNSPTIGDQVRGAILDGKGDAEIVAAAGGQALEKHAKFNESMNPTNGMSDLDLLITGVDKSLSDTGHGLKQVGARIKSWLPNALGGDDGEAVAQLQQEQAERERHDAPLMDTGYGAAGNMLGGAAQAVATLPIGGAAGALANTVKGAGMGAKAARALPRAVQTVINPSTMPGAVASGAAIGALMPTKSSEETMWNATLGGATGGVIQGVLGRSITPTAQAQKLIDQGITPTIGQAKGGVIGAMEEKATSVPFVGDVIRSARNRAIDDMNVVALNRAAPDGLKVTAPGHEAIAALDDALDASYTKVLGDTKIKIDREARQGWQAVQAKIADTDRFLSAAERQQLTEFVQGQFAKATNGKTSFPAAKAKAMQSAMRKRADELAKQQNFEMAAAVRDLAETVGDWWKGQLPATTKAALKDTDQAYSNFVRVQAAAKAAGDDGVFTPKQLLAAVKATDVGRKARFAKGQAPMQDLASPSVVSLGDKIPNSGTADRTLGVVGALFSPATIPAAIAAKGLYSKAALQHLMSTSPLRQASTAYFRGGLIKDVNDNDD